MRWSLDVWAFWAQLCWKREANLWSCVGFESWEEIVAMTIPETSRRRRRPVRPIHRGSATTIREICRIRGIRDQWRHSARREFLGMWILLPTEWDWTPGRRVTPSRRPIGRSRSFLYDCLILRMLFARGVALADWSDRCYRRHRRRLRRFQ